MKVIWEAEDIRPGRQYKMPGTKEVWMIGYEADRDKGMYVSVSLSDGMVSYEEKAVDFAESLNVAGYMPMELEP